MLMNDSCSMSHESCNTDYYSVLKLDSYTGCSQESRLDYILATGSI